MIVVEVTQSDIRGGVRASTCNCPMAKAVKRYYGIRGYGVTVGAGRVTFRYAGHIMDTGSCKLTKKVQEFIYAFDNYEAVKPSKFKLNLPKRRQRGG